MTTAGHWTTLDAVLVVLVVGLLVAILVLLIGQQQRQNRAAILALSCRLQPAEVPATIEDDWSVGRLSVLVTNSGTTPVRNVVVEVEMIAADGRIGSYGDIRVNRLGAGTTEVAVSGPGRTPLTGGLGRVSVHFSIRATDIAYRTWIRNRNDEVTRYWGSTGVTRAS